jgi:SAM-dependent methyltransferase
MTNRFNERYKTGDLPWNINRPDFNLVGIVESHPVEPCKALDIGCGTGDNVIWLAREGFEVTGVDYAETAIHQARIKAEESKITSVFYTIDFLKNNVPGAPFGFIFDRGCFHSCDDAKERKLYARNVFKYIEKDGLWLTLTGNVDDGRLETGPPKLTARDVVSAVEPFFEILSLTSGRFDSNDTQPSKIWICLMKKRN